MSKTEPTVDELAERVRELENRAQPTLSQQDVQDYLDKLPVSRRQLLAAVAAGTISLPLLYADIAQASQGSDGEPYACVWLGDQNADGHDLDNVGNLTFEGSGGGTVTGGRWGETDADGLLEILNDGISGIDVGTVNTEQVATKVLPDVIVYIDGSEAVAVSSTGEVDRQDATDNGLSVIHSAVDALPSGGGRVHVRAGRYSESNVSFDPPAIPIAKNNVTISGDGAKTVLTIEDDATATDEGVRIIHVGGDDVTPQWNGTNAYEGFEIRNLTIDGNQQNNRPISGNTDGHNIQIQGSDFLVHNVRSINATGDGVEPISRSDPPVTTDSVVSECLFLDCFEQHIHPHGCERVVFANNVCNGEVNNSAVNLFAQDTDNRYLIFTGNHILNSQESGVVVHNNGGTASEVSEHIYFIGNWVRGNGSAGFSVNPVGCNDIYIINNIIEGNAGNGISGVSAKNTLIQGNVVRGNDGVGITATSSNAAIKNFVIDGNYVFDNDQTGSGSSSVVVKADGNDVTNGMVSNNTIINPRETNSKSIFFNEVTAATYSNLFCHGNFMVGHSGGFMIVNDLGANVGWNFGDRFQFARSSAPSSGGDFPVYLDDGTNTETGQKAFRARDAGSFDDIGLIEPQTGATYSTSNVTTDRSYDADATTTDELADVLGTLIADLQAANNIG